MKKSWRKTIHYFLVRKNKWTKEYVKNTQRELRNIYMHNRLTYKKYRYKQIDKACDLATK